jgi:hypothetical protein
MKILLAVGAGYIGSSLTPIPLKHDYEDEYYNIRVFKKLLGGN